VRDADRGDAVAIGEVSSAAVPHLVRSSARVEADMRDDERLGRRRWVGLIDRQVAGTATARQVVEPRGEQRLHVDVAVRPRDGSQGVGTRLLTAAVQAFPGATRLEAVADGGPISLSFAVRNGFVPEDEQPLVRVDPSSVPPADRGACGLRPVTLEALPDLRMLLETHNLATAEDRRWPRLTMYQLRNEWWGRPDNAPDLSWGLLAPGPNGPVLASFTSVQVDHERRRAWSRMTATHPAFRDQGLATWVKRRSLGSLADADVAEAWARVPSDNAPMLAVNEALGYWSGATAVALGRRLRRGSDPGEDRWATVSR